MLWAMWDLGPFLKKQINYYITLLGVWVYAVLARHLFYETLACIKSNLCKSCCLDPPVSPSDITVDSWLCGATIQPSPLCFPTESSHFHISTVIFYTSLLWNWTLRPKASPSFLHLLVIWFLLRVQCWGEQWGVCTSALLVYNLFIAHIFL